MSEFESFLEHEAGLWHGSLKGVYQQKNAVYHFEDTLNLAGEVRMAGGIDNVDLYAVVHTGCVLRENGDSALTLECVAVHYSVAYYLILAESSALLKHLIDQRCLAVVNVGDYCNIP